MEKLSFYRANYSPYFGEDFKEKEREALSYVANNQIDKSLSPSILITNTDTNLEDIYKRGILRETQLIIHPNSGYDNFSKDFVKKLGIPIILGNKIRKEAVVNYCLSCVFSNKQSPPWRSAWQAGRRWQRAQLGHQQALIIGNGHIGSSLSKKLNLIFENVYIHDPRQGKNAISKKSVVDYIFICASLTRSSRGMINSEFLSDVKKNVTIINPARGKIIRLTDLKYFLQKNLEAFAFLDVFPSEPYSLKEFTDLPNLKTSCHIAGVFDNIDQAIINFEKEVITDFSKMSKSDFLIKYEDQILNQSSKMD